MPELPEVESVVRTIRPSVVGRRIVKVDVHRPDIISPTECDLAACLTGRTVAAIERRGKRIVFALDDANRFYVHLGMTGRLTIEPASADVARHTHVVLRLDPSPTIPADEVRFVDPRRFGGVWWLGDAADDGGAMGPEPLTIRAAALARRLARTRRPIKAALLDQAVVAGLGNIYVDEALHAAGLPPTLAASSLSPADVARLTRAVKTILRRAIRHRGSTLRDYRDANGNVGVFQKLHRVYGREGEPCHVCGTAIVRVVLGGRGTHFCPTCQPTHSR